jgi:integrase
VADAEKHDQVLAVAIAMAALTGARRGELAALRWSDVSGDRLTIARALSMAKGVRYEGDTKTHQVRIISLGDVAQEVLRQRRAYMESLSAEADSPLVPDPYILSYRADGAEPVNPDTITGGFHRCAKRVGLTHHFHELRHFSATTAIAAGVDPRTVGGRLGHRDASVTLKTYAHVLEAQDQNAAAILGAALTKGK